MQNGPSRSYKMVQILFLAGDTVKFIGGNFCKISSVLKMSLSGWNFQKKKFEKPLHHSQGKKITVWKVIIYLSGFWLSNVKLHSKLDCQCYYYTWLKDLCACQSTVFVLEPPFINCFLKWKIGSSWLVTW